MKTLTAMKKYVISVGRQFGSGGHDIGKKLAERLGIKFYDKELLLEAAKEIGANPELFKKNDEKLPSFYINNLSMNLGFTCNLLPRVRHHHTTTASKKPYATLSAQLPNANLV